MCLQCAAAAAAAAELRRHARVLRIVPAPSPGHVLQRRRRHEDPRPGRGRAAVTPVGALAAAADAPVTVGRTPAVANAAARCRERRGRRSNPTVEQGPKGAQTQINSSSVRVCAATAAEAAADALAAPVRPPDRGAEGALRRQLRSDICLVGLSLEALRHVQVHREAPERDVASEPRRHRHRPVDHGEGTLHDLLGIVPARMAQCLLGHHRCRDFHALAVGGVPKREVVTRIANQDLPLVVQDLVVYETRRAVDGNAVINCDGRQSRHRRQRRGSRRRNVISSRGSRPTIRDRDGRHGMSPHVAVCSGGPDFACVGRHG
mmetsp:Transcript_5346/g.20140  ORF Transcript_5346/g.20140 Transcript_5346/m.20140 type:complete len:319 (-) Transcript_5346:1474-2430(-)